MKTYDIPLALQVAHYARFKHELSTRLAVELTTALLTKNEWPQYLVDWLASVRETTKPEERAPTVKYLLNKLYGGNS